MIPNWVLYAAIASLLALLGVQTVRLSDQAAKTAQIGTSYANYRTDVMASAAAESEKAHKKESDLRSQVDSLQVASLKEKEDAKAREGALLERVRSGERRLSIPARCIPAGGGQAGADSAPSGVGGAEVQRAELDPATSERVLRITLDGDDAIRERNTCVAAYNRVRELINAPQGVASAGALPAPGSSEAHH